MKNITIFYPLLVLVLLASTFAFSAGVGPATQDDEPNPEEAFVYTPADEVPPQHRARLRTLLRDIADGNLAAVKLFFEEADRELLLLAVGPVYNYVGEGGPCNLTLLHIMAREGHTDKVRFLLERARQTFLSNPTALLYRVNDIQDENFRRRVIICILTFCPNLATTFRLGIVEFFVHQRNVDEILIHLGHGPSHIRERLVTAEGDEGSLLNQQFDNLQVFDREAFGEFYADIGWRLPALNEDATRTWLEARRAWERVAQTAGQTAAILAVYRAVDPTIREELVVLREWAAGIAQLRHIPEEYAYWHERITEATTAEDYAADAAYEQMRGYYELARMMWEDIELFANTIQAASRARVRTDDHEVAIGALGEVRMALYEANAAERAAARALYVVDGVLRIRHVIERTALRAMPLFADNLQTQVVNELIQRAQNNEGAAMNALAAIAERDQPAGTLLPHDLRHFVTGIAALVFTLKFHLRNAS